MLRFVIHNVLLHALVPALFVVGISWIANIRRAAGVGTIAVAVCIAFTFAFTALSWRFRMEFPGNYPLSLHLISAAVPVTLGALIGFLASLLVRRINRAT